MVKLNEKYSGWNAETVSSVYDMAGALKKGTGKLEVKLRNGVMSFEFEGKKVDLFLKAMDTEDLADILAVHEIR